MKKLVGLASVFAVLVCSGFAVSAADDKATAKDVMKINKGPKAAFGVLKAQLGSASPEWEVIKKAAKTYGTEAAKLPHTEAPKGDQAGYEKLSKAFAASGKALADAAAKEDLDGVKAAAGKIGMSCMGCHKAHKP
ncbi:MAG: cytochrome c [Isosphaeraceae bacterium]|nr:cytochrome c [Isosphaeraceae bacterium]